MADQIPETLQDEEDISSVLLFRRQKKSGKFKDISVILYQSVHKTQIRVTDIPSLSALLYFREKIFMLFILHQGTSTCSLENPLERM